MLLIILNVVRLQRFCESNEMTLSSKQLDSGDTVTF